MFESLVVSQSSLSPFEIPFKTPFSLAGQNISVRTGFYLTLSDRQGNSIQSEAAPLPGFSKETLKHCRHDLQEIQPHLKNFKIPVDAKSLTAFLRTDEAIGQLCPSAKFAVESALYLLAARSQDLSLAEFLGAKPENVSSAGLLQGPYETMITDAKKMAELGIKVIKLKVGDRNIPLDVKKVKDLRTVIGPSGSLRLDGNRIWSLNEALLFVDLIGPENIDFIEEPLSDISQLNQFYQQSHFPVALDETLTVVRCGANAPGRCSPTLAHHEAVKAYILKPMLLGFIETLDWIEEARHSCKKAIISSAFESAIGLKILANLALITGQVPGLGTGRWLQGEHIVNEQGIIVKDLLK